MIASRRGFSLIELMISMMILMFITSAAVLFLRRQTGLMTSESARMEAMQNGQFGTSQIERELREAGAGVVDAQPMLIQADTTAITFNANMVSIDTGDVAAVYQFGDADTNGTRSMQQAERLALPNSTPTVLYPDTNYFASGGVPSAAETISYFLRPDSTGSIPGRYLLFRRVNGLAPTLMSRGIVRDSRDTVPLFSYFKADTLNRLFPVARAILPIYHVAIHGSPVDTGRRAVLDSVQTVRIHLVTAARDLRTGRDALRSMDITVRLLNAGLLHRSSCGAAPGSVTTPNVTSSPGGAVQKRVTVAWVSSADDGRNEKDVERYAIFRRPSSALTFADPIASVPAAQRTNYSWIDTSVLPGQTYIYGIAAQDCTPQLSAVTASAPVNVLP